MKKFSEYFILAVLFMTLMSTCNTCSLSRDVSKLRKQTDSMSSVINNTYSKDQLDIVMEIKGLETAKRILYDQNAIVRTVERPDDRMAEYDKQIKLLEDKLKSSK